MHTLKQKCAFAGGVIVTLFVVFPPMNNMSERLFSFHMTQHLLLIAVAAPLLIISRYLKLLQPDPVTAWIAFVGIFLFWHWPAAFQWAARNEASRLLEHGSILFGVLLFWSVALSAKGQEWLGYGARALFVVTAAAATDLPGVIMVFSPHAFCAMPMENSTAWGLTPIEDQQIAGMLMWVPANLVFFSIATWLFSRWLSEPQIRASNSLKYNREII